MRRGRRNGLGQEFGGSGEDSFVAVVVTKLTGALLFILLLTMVIMALIPRAEMARKSPSGEPEPPPLTIATPEALPEAIVGRPYALALAALGGTGNPLSWRVDGPLPEGLSLDTATGLLHGTPKTGTPAPVDLRLTVRDGAHQASRPARLVVYQPDRPLALAARWKPGLPPVPWRAWMQQGFGFLLLMMVHLVGMNSLATLERVRPDARRRFLAYRAIVRLASLAGGVGLAVWLVLQQAT